MHSDMKSSVQRAEQSSANGDRSTTSLKIADLWRWLHVHFLVRISFPRGVSVLFLEDLCTKASKSLPITAGYINELDFLDILMFHFVFFLSLLQTFWGFLIQFFALVMFILELPFWCVSKPQDNLEEAALFRHYSFCKVTHGWKVPFLCRKW